MATPGMPDPNVTPITSDTSATGVGPAPAPAAPPQQPAPATPVAPAAPAAPDSTAAQPQQPGSMWKAILQGALAGLAGSAGSKSFGGGLAGGAAGYLQQQQQQFQNQQQAAQNQSTIKFRDIQSAHMAAQLAAENAQLAHLPEQYQQQRDEHAASMAELFQKNGWGTYQPVDISTADGPMKYLASQPDGASVPGHTITGASVAFVPTSNDPNGQYEMYKTLAPALGFAAMDRGQWQQLTPEQRAQAARQVNNVVNGRKMDGTMYSPSELPQAVQQMQSTIDRAKKNGQPDSALQVLTAAQGELKSQLDAVHAEDDRKFAHQKEIAATRAATFNDSKVIPVDNPDGTTGYMRAGNAVNSGATHSGNAMLMGTLADGRQVAGSAQELQAAGATSVSKLDANEGGKVRVARQLVAPNGLFHNVGQDIKALEASGDLGTIGSRWNDFMSGKVGTGPAFAKLRTDMGLLSTALMQAHVGARGSDQMREHFLHLADYRISDAATLKAALSSEFNYVTEKAAFVPKGGK